MTTSNRAKLSDFGQRMRLVPAIEFRIGLHFGPEMPAHLHIGELRHYQAQVCECLQCGFWVPIGAPCPACRAQAQKASE
jgi:hypothetical protein